MTLEMEGQIVISYLNLKQPGKTKYVDDDCVDRVDIDGGT
jgi:hypothetical protein